MCVYDSRPDGTQLEQGKSPSQGSDAAADREARITERTGEGQGRAGKAKVSPGLGVV